MTTLGLGEFGSPFGSTGERLLAESLVLAISKPGPGIGPVTIR